MARQWNTWQGKVNEYLESLKGKGAYRGSQGEGGVEGYGYADSPYFQKGRTAEDYMNDESLRRDLAQRIGVTDFDSVTTAPDETEMGTFDFFKIPAIFAALAMTSGAASGMFAGAGAASSLAATDAAWGANAIPGGAGWGTSTLPGVMGEGVGAGVNAAGVTTGAGAGTGSMMPSWLTPGTAMSGVGAAATMASLGGDGGYTPATNAAFSAPSAGPNYGQFGSSVSDMANQTSNIAGIGPQTSSVDPYGLGWTDQSGEWGASVPNASSGSWNLPGNLGNMANWGAADWGNAVGGLAGIGSGIYGMTQANSLKTPIDFSASSPANIDFTSGNLDFNSMLKPGAPIDFSAADPWGTSGGRDVAGAKLKTLLSDPSALYGMPGWQAGQEAVQRSMAAQGYTGSGNAMAALQKYGGDYYNQAIQQLTTLSGGAQDPSTISKLQLSQQGQNQQQQQAAAQLSLSQLNQDSTLALQQRGQNQQLQLGGAQLNTQREIVGNTLASQSLASLGYGGQRLLGGAQQPQNDPRQFAQMMQLYNMGRGLV